MKKLHNLTLILCLFFSSICFAKKPTPIYFWHAMAGRMGVVLQTLVDQFNQKQKDYRIVSVYKGDYSELLTSTIAAFRSHQHPHLVQIYEIGAGTMMFPEGAIIPVWKVLRDNQIKLGKHAFWPSIRKYYSDKKQRLIAFPFNMSVALLYFDKKAFARAGLNPDKAPATWPSVEKASRALLKAGYPCGFTTTWPSWTQIEGFGVRHHSLFSDHDNGFDGEAKHLLFDNPKVIFHLEHLVTWQQEHIFQYGGRRGNALALFNSGHCPMVIDTSGSLVDLKKVFAKRLGVGRLPFWPELVTANASELLGGGALWVLTEHESDEYQGVARFLQYLAKPKIQAYWQQQSGYLANSRPAMQLNQKQRYFIKYPEESIPQRLLMVTSDLATVVGIRLGYYQRLRDINDDVLEKIFSGRVTVRVGLKEAVRRGEEVLQVFKDDVKG